MAADCLARFWSLDINHDIDLAGLEYSFLGTRKGQYYNNLKKDVCDIFLWVDPSSLSIDVHVLPTVSKVELCGKTKAVIFYNMNFSSMFLNVKVAVFSTWMWCCMQVSADWYPNENTYLSEMLT